MSTRVVLSTTHGGVGMNDKLLILVRTLLVLISLAATFVFLMGMGSGVGVLLFAAGGTLAQIAALIWLPVITTQSWSEGRLLMATASGSALVMVLLISVTGSVSILSGLVDEQQQAAGQRVALESLLMAKQESANRLIALDRVTKAQPILKEVEQLREKLNALPAPSGFYLAAQRVGGNQAGQVVTVIIVTLSALLDAVVLLLGSVTQTVTSPVTRASGAVTQTVTQAVTPVTTKTVPLLPTVIPSNDPELVAVQEAIEAGHIKQPSVRSVRDMLGCGQKRAMEIARIFRDAEEQMELL